jgi:hypothetical protein
MMFRPRFLRIAGVFAVGLAALLAAGGQASAASCSLAFGTSGTTLTISRTLFTDDLSGTTSVTLSASGMPTATVTSLSVTPTQVILTIPDEPVPTVTGVNGGSDHAAGLTSGGGSLTINGSDFLPTIDVTIHGGSCDGSSGSFLYNDVTAVNIGGTAATLNTIFTTNTSINVTTPPGIAGVADIVVFTAHENSGTDGSKRFAYLQGGPSVNGVGPNQGLTTVATPVTISGLNLVPGTFHDGTAVTTVSFPCPNASTVTPQGAATVSATAGITLTTPTCSQSGAVNVTVTNTLGSATGQYQYVAPGTPHVTSISPATGNTLGNTSVTISGSNFIGTTKVTFGAVDVPGFQLNSAGSITVSTPPQSFTTPTDVQVTVTVNNGTSLVTSTENVLFHYIPPPPVVNLINPASGSTAGGTNVTIFGQYFGNASAVTIGGAAATITGVSSDGTQITAVTGAHAAGTGLAVVVTTPSGTGTGTAPNGIYTYGTPAPTVSSVSPNTGGISGGTSVTITGTNFTGATSVTFGGAAATNVVVVDPQTITAKTPAHAAGFVDVAVTTAAGTGTGTNLYSYSASPPTVTGISPAAGSTTGGTSVTITGTNFNGTPQVTIGGVAASQVTVVNSTTLTAVTPAGTGSVQVAVTTSFGTSAANPPGSTYTYVAPVAPAPPAPTVTGVSPGFGTTLGLTPVTITGTNLTGATSVTFGGNPATNVIVVNATTITALTPPGAAGSVAVAVTTPGGTGTLAAAYQYVVTAPTVTAVNPNTGTNLGGSAVTISGTNFTGATAVTFGGVLATNVTVLTATTITATTPAGTGTVNVAVTTQAGTGTGTNLYTYVTQSPPYPPGKHRLASLIFA